MPKNSLENLAIAVIKQAVRDLSGSGENRLDAENFFVSACLGESESSWFEIINVNPRIIFRPPIAESSLFGQGLWLIASSQKPLD